MIPVASNVAPAITELAQWRERVKFFMMFPHLQLDVAQDAVDMTDEPTVALELVLATICQKLTIARNKISSLMCRGQEREGLRLPWP